MIELNIDGKTVTAKEGETLLEVATDNQIRIPTLCYHKKLSPIGSCRVCMVEVQGARKPMPACQTLAVDGMVVRTNTEDLHELRRTAIQLMLLNHKMDCLVCPKSGDCALQDLAYEYGVDGHGFGDISVELKVGSYATPLIQYHPERCIMCGRCTRACREVKGIDALSINLRGSYAHIKGNQAICISCGECLHVCPVGALTQNVTHPPFRTHKMKKVRTTCPYCGVGCQLELNVADGKVVEITTNDDIGPNKGTLCVKGRFGFDFIHHRDRITRPLIKENGRFEEVSWEEAWNFAADNLKRIKEDHGGHSIMGLTSARCTNEENYLFQKFMRAVIGTNNVDHCARLCHSTTVAGLAAAFGSGAMTNSIEDIGDSDCILITGSNTSECHPVIADLVRRAVQRKGAKLIVIDPRRIELAKLAHLFLQPRPGTDVAWINGMMNVIWKEGLWDREFVEERTENFDSLIRVIEKYTPSLVQEITAIPAPLLEKAARMYGSTSKASVPYAMGLTQHITGTDNVKSVANLAMLTGNLGKRGSGVYPLRGQNNVQGACDMGGLPGVYPGYQPVTNPEIRAKFEKAWGVNLSPKQGLCITEVADKINQGQIRAL